MPLFGHRGLPAWKKSLPEERPLKNMSLVWPGYAVVLSLKALCVCVCVWGGGGGVAIIHVLVHPPPPPPTHTHMSGFAEFRSAVSEKKSKYVSVN